MQEVGVVWWGVCECVYGGGGCCVLGAGDSRAPERGETVQDKDHCHRNAHWASVSNCSVLSNISCHDNGIFTEIDTQTGQSQSKNRLNASTTPTVQSWAWHFSRLTHFAPYTLTAQARIDWKQGTLLGWCLLSLLHNRNKHLSTRAAKTKLFMSPDIVPYTSSILT